VFSKDPGMKGGTKQPEELIGYHYIEVEEELLVVKLGEVGVILRTVDKISLTTAKLTSNSSFQMIT
jgi:hypothetical protein